MHKVLSDLSNIMLDPRQHESQTGRVEINVSYKTIYRLHLEGPVEIDKMYVKAGLKGRERDQSEQRNN